MSDADQFMSCAAEDELTAQEQTNRDRAGPGSSSRSQESASNATYTHESDKCNDRAEPCSWREMYRAMGVPQPDNEP